MKYKCKMKQASQKNGGPGETRFVYNIPATIEATNNDEAFDRYLEHLLAERDRYAHYLAGKITMFVFTDEDDDSPDDFPRWYERQVII